MYNRIMEAMEENKMNTAGAPLVPETSGFALSLTTVINIIFSLVLVGIVSAAGLQTGTDAYIYPSYIVPQLALFAGVAITVAARKVSFKETFPVKCHPKYYLIAAMLIFGLLFCLGEISTPIEQFFKLIGYRVREKKDVLPNLSGGLVVPALLVIGVLPAIFEESLFRGVILRGCEEKAGTLATVLIVGMSFSLYHTSPEQTVYQFFAGCVFAFIALRSGSILPSVLMHFTNNALIVIFGACGLLDGAGNTNFPFAVDLTLGIIGGLCLVGGILWLVFDGKHAVPFKKGEKGAVVRFFKYAAIGLAALAVMWITSLIAGFLPE